MKSLFLFSLLVLSSCQTATKLPSCSGPVFPLNVGRWQPTPVDLEFRPPSAQR
ncbi:type IV secretion system lipoprotein VirB7 [Rhizobium skierniewicense]|uniref:type IV secretion system lipoprotein VirB7 n=1 Tax=Rhizobium TaxID=379 RepID=UPI00177CD9A3|nr:MULTISPECIES: type IV secretion system lipoprotein VirB7 [Rhizobium]MBD8689856.1 type IV secretion system lipoprotein VirB7 [Rhizobium sp. CFBP 13644]MBD8694445.1 type IV secretion system lipoprotein VirB7 [Rhizobium sp. CFBP 13717]MCI9868568.1 type IV secretion system lipoprotein VirB7 [Rhizobium skierniewicense]